MSTDIEKAKPKKPLATICLGAIVIVIFLIIIFSYQVEDRETALVVTTSRVSDKPVAAGLHFRWPYPIQKIVKFDNRYRIFDGNVGRLEETLTKDSHNIIAGIYTIYKISDPVTFYKELEDVTKAEERLNAWMRSVKTETFGRYTFSQLVNDKAENMKLAEMEADMTKRLREMAAKSGIEIKMVGIRAINIPEKVSEEVFKRMIAERQTQANEYRAKGIRDAQDIRTKADGKVSEIVAGAEAEAQKIRAEGDAAAAQYYAVFKDDPELAAFLRKLEALKKVIQDKTTLILDFNTAPFDLFKTNADTLAAPAKAANQ